MKDLKWLFVIGCLVCSGAYLTRGAKAGEWDQKTLLTFDESVELPGIVLPAGTYVFKLADSPVDRDIVQVFSQNERKLFATIKTVPNYRAKDTEQTSLIFEQRTAGEPRMLKEWFFPDRRYGHEFVYSRSEPLQVAKADNSTNTISPAEYRDPSPENSEQVAPSEENSYLQLVSHESAEPVELAKADEPESSDRPAESGEPAYVQASDQSQSELQTAQTSDKPAGIRKMPRTASSLPLVLLSGLFLVATSFGLRLCSKRIG